MITITRFDNIFKDALVTPLTQVITTTVTRIGFEYGLESINSTDSSVDESSHGVFIATNGDDNRDVLSPQVIEVGVEFLDVIDKIYENRIIFDILENENDNENQIRFKIFICCNEYVLDEYPYNNEINNEYCCNKGYYCQSSCVFGVCLCENNSDNDNEKISGMPIYAEGGAIIASQEGEHEEEAAVIGMFNYPCTSKNVWV